MKFQLIVACAILLFIIAILSDSAWAQELEPRAYQPAPIGLNAFTFSYTHSTGDILFEPSFPAEDVQANLHLESAGYYHTFDFFGRFANVSVGVPYAAGHLNGRVEGISREIYRSGLGDIRTRFAMSLKGTPAMTMAEFIKHHRKTNIGVSLVVSAPTGQYDPKKVINVGQNRWAFKPEVGLSKFYKKWQMDVYGGVWFFSAN
ncbi:MAG TPA: transporter, partial [Acidobacteriota bacterium]|nr:transporter [Acidobacteriota bacterium]